MGSRTAEQAKQDYIRAMGEPLGTLYNALWQEVAWLYVVWQEYVELYGSKPSRIDLLNEAAPLFFRITQDALWEGTILHIARLTDPAKSAGKSNLTIQAIPILINDSGFESHLAGLIDQATRASGFCRDWRNRHIAHRDLALAIDTGAQQLEPASRWGVREALDAIAAVLNAVSVQFTDAEVRFDVMMNVEGAVSLLYVIDDGLRVEAEREEKLQRGESAEYQRRDL
jgi:hypothetical protein